VTQPTERRASTAMHTNRGEKQELEATVLLESYDLAGITETWWDKSHDCSVAIDGYRLFRRDRQGRGGGGVALYVKKLIQCEELSLKNAHEQVESRRVWPAGRGRFSFPSTLPW